MTLSSEAGGILVFALILWAGFLMTRVTKLAHLPHVTGYLLAGIIIGPQCLGLVSSSTVVSLDLITDMALAIIAFGTGKYFKFSTLRANGGDSLIITVMESLAAAILVTVGVHFLFDLDWMFCMMLGAIGSATAPASTLMTIRQYNAKGRFVELIIQVTAIDDAVAIIAFSLTAAIIQARSNSMSFDVHQFLLPLLLNLASLGLGTAAAYLLRFLIARRHSDDHRLMVTIATILTLTGVCSLMNVSPLLCCMVLGAVYRNISDDDNLLFALVNGFAPPVLLAFFVVSGMKLNIASLAKSGAIGVAYFIIRIIGKYIGAFVGASMTHQEKPIRNYLGMALCPQAGVSIGLAALGQRLLPADLSDLLSTIILSSAVLYEIIGPACAKAALFLSGTIKKEGATCEREITNSGL
ncbi:MAG: cation:proton antiporter [Sphaerochaetaceae bacterium]|nr:cation:proton antiporter [Sphaerochaetaceae bacterium]